MKNTRFIGLLFIAIFFAACSVPKAEIALINTQRHLMADTNASKQSVLLFYNLKQVAKKQVMFGHMEDNLNGYSGWIDVPGKSDVFEVSGAYPAVYGFDFGHITSFTHGKYTDQQTKVIHQQVIEAYKRNGVITFSWHYNNPVSKGSFYWKDSPISAVNQILPGGANNRAFVESLCQIANFASKAKYHGKLIPIIFRPFHEFDGDWFWWGKAHCTAEEYKALYRYTVSYLRDTLRVTNFLYAWSPDCNFNTTDEYTARYPGKTYVDVLGMDDYFDLRTDGSLELAAKKLQIVNDFALQQSKIAALTETGLENLPQNDWYTSRLLKVLKAGHMQIAYAMVWSNRPHSFWTPYRGHPALEDFINFKNDPLILFGDTELNVYKLAR